MHVLHVYKNYAPMRGGIETHIRQLATGLVRRGDKATVLVAATGIRGTVEIREGVTVRRAGCLGEVASTPISVDLIRLVGSIDADVIHVHMPYPVGEIGALLGARGRPVVVTYHSDVVRQRWAMPLYGPLTRTLLRRAQCVIATSPTYVKTSPILRQIASRCTVVPLGVDLSRFRPDPGRVAALSQRLLGDDATNLVLFVGRFRSYKGLPYLIEAARKVDARFVLVGSGPLQRQLEAQIATSGLREKVQFVGEVDDETLSTLYAAADVVVLPSTQRSEAFGIVLLEAMASGRPVISTELGTGTSWVNQHGVTGLVVKPSDPDALVVALSTLLGDSQMRERYGHAGRARVEGEFGLKQMVERLAAFYHEVLG